MIVSLGEPGTPRLASQFAKGHIRAPMPVCKTLTTMLVEDKLAACAQALLRTASNGQRAQATTEAAATSGQAMHCHQMQCIHYNGVGETYTAGNAMGSNTR